MKKAYYYLFYKLYRFSEAAPSRWLSDWKASLTIDILELFILISIIYYFDVSLGNGIAFYMLFAFGISIPNYFIFHHREQWKQIVKDFDKIPKKKNIIGSFVVFAVVLFIITNLIFSVYYMDQKARKNKTGPYSNEYIESSRK